MPSSMHTVTFLAAACVAAAAASQAIHGDVSNAPISTGNEPKRILQTAICDSATCACDGERAQDCGATNPDRPQSCCGGYVCAGGSKKTCVAADAEPTAGETEDPTPTTTSSSTQPKKECGIDVGGTRCEDGMCCSADGICGYTSECGSGCQSGPCDYDPSTDPVAAAGIPTPEEYQPLSTDPPQFVNVEDLSKTDAETYNLLTGCGKHMNDESSLRYAAVMLDMHRAMSINYTGNDEYDFLAGMIPHHNAAVDMCSVYYHAAYAAGTVNEGIESLCYNITYGPVDAMGYGAEYQSDFSQVGETKQMMDILEQLGMVQHYERGCDGLSHDAMKELAIEADEAISGGSDFREGMVGGSVGEQRDSGKHPAAAWWDVMRHKSMFMGCGRLDEPSTKDYLAAGMKMHMRMAFEWTGDPAVDFLLGMLPHHEGAIEMCDIYYKYWSCAPSKSVCMDPLPLDVVQRMMSNHESVSTLNAMHHICEGHILTTQPKEVQWMKSELNKLNPQALADYEAQVDGNGVFLIDQISCAEKYIEIKSSNGEVLASGSDLVGNMEQNTQQCAQSGEKARSCGASSHKWMQDCCEGLRCADKRCIDTSTVSNGASAENIDYTSEGTTATKGDTSDGIVKSISVVLVVANVAFQFISHYMHL